MLATLSRIRRSIKDDGLTWEMHEAALSEACGRRSRLSMAIGFVD
jgi:hypothetical protein